MPKSCKFEVFGKCISKYCSSIEECDFKKGVSTVFIAGEQQGGDNNEN